MPSCCFGKAVFYFLKTFCNSVAFIIIVLIFVTVIQRMKNKFFGFHLDSLGAIASTICLIHCLILPVVVTLVGVGLPHHVDHQFEVIFMCFAVILAIPALTHGFISHHRNWLPILIGGTGLLLLTIPILLHIHWHGATISGCFLLLGAHYLNWRLGKKVAVLAKS